MLKVLIEIEVWMAEELNMNANKAADAALYSLKFSHF